MLSPGDKVKDCEVIAPLGSGGMARLYLARRRGVGGFSRLVTLKLVHPHLIEDEKIVKLFLDEARISAHVAHPNVVHVEEVGRVDGSYFIAMEYVHGASLAELLAQLTDHRLRLRPKLCVWLAAQIAEALHAAHEARSENGTPLGIVHRDVSPQNVLISHTGHVKLIDFGIARDQAEEDPWVAGRAVLGKLRYMSPEQLRLMPADRRADVYALGVMLWEMIAGRNLLRCQRLDDDSDWTIRENPPPPSKYSGHSTPSLDRVVQKAIAYDPNERYDSAFQFRAALLRADPAAVTLDAPMVAALMRSMFGDELDNRRASWPSEIAGQLEHESDETSRKWSLEELTAENVGMLPMLELQEFAREQQARDAAEQTAAVRAPAAIPALPEGDAASTNEASALDANAGETPDGGDACPVLGDDEDAEPTIAIRGRRRHGEMAAIGALRLPSESPEWLLETSPSERPSQPVIASVRADLMRALASANLSYEPAEGLRLSQKSKRPAEPRSVRALPGMAALRLGLANVRGVARMRAQQHEEDVIDMPATTTAAVVVADNAIDTLKCPAVPIQALEVQQPPGLAFRITTLGSACLVVGVFLGTLLARSPATAPPPTATATALPVAAPDDEVLDPLVVESRPLAAAKRQARAAMGQLEPSPLPTQDCVAAPAKERVLTTGYRDALDTDTQADALCEERAALGALGATPKRALPSRETRAFGKHRSAWRSSKHGSSGGWGTKRYANRRAKWAARSTD